MRVSVQSVRSQLTSRRLGLWLPVLLYAAAIFLVSSMHNPPMPDGVSDKSGHRAAYCGLGLVVLRALAGAEWAGISAGTSLAAVGLTTAFGASDELHQVFVSGSIGRCARPRRGCDRRGSRGDGRVAGGDPHPATQE